MAFAGRFVFKLVAGAVSDAGNREEQRIVHALRRDVFDGDFAIEAMPRSADEVDGDGFVDAYGCVRKDGDFGVETFDAQLFGERRWDVQEADEAKKVEEELRTSPLEQPE